MAKSLNAILAVARERISGGNPAGRMGSEQSTSLGKDPGVDYAPKPEGERKFVAKHKHIEMEYPNGNEKLFKGDVNKYSMTDTKMKNYGNTQDQAKAAYEEVEQVDEKLSPKTKGHIRNVLDSGMTKKGTGPARALIKLAKEEAIDEVWKATTNAEGQHVLKHHSGKVGSKTYGSKGEAIDAAVRRNKANNVFKESSLQEVWKATTNDQGQHVLKHHSGKVGSKTYGSKGEAIDAAVRRNKSNNVFKEDFLNQIDTMEEEQIDEISKKTLGSYVKGAARSLHHHRAEMVRAASDRSKHSGKDYSKASDKFSKRLKGIDRASDKLAKEETELEWIAEIDIEEGAVLCDKGSLRKKAKYHKGKMKDEQAGSPRFRHHQRQAHIIKGMLEEATDLTELSKAIVQSYAKKAQGSVGDKSDPKRAKRFQGVMTASDKVSGRAKVNSEEVEQIDEKKKENIVTFIDKNGKVVKQRGYHSKKKELTKEETIETPETTTPTVDPVVTRAVDAITKGQFKWQK